MWVQVILEWKSCSALFTLWILYLHMNTFNMVPQTIPVWKSYSTVPISYSAYQDKCLFLMCFLTFSWLVNAKGHNWHLYFIFRWTLLTWVLILPIWEKVAPHSLHSWSFIFKWTLFSCCVRVSFSEKAAPHSPHMWSFVLKWTLLSCLFKFCFSEKEAPHSLHKCSFNFKWTLFLQEIFSWKLSSTILTFMLLNLGMHWYNMPSKMANISSLIGTKFTRELSEFFHFHLDSLHFHVATWDAKQ